MKANDNDRKLDELIHQAIGRDDPAFNFERWKQEHRPEIDEFRRSGCQETDLEPSCDAYY